MQRNQFELTRGGRRSLRPIKVQIQIRIKMEDQAYRKLQREYQSVKKILRTLTPEAGEVWEIYSKRLAELEKKYTPLKVLRKTAPLRKAKLKKQEQDIEVKIPEANFFVSW